MAKKRGPQRFWFTKTCVQCGTSFPSNRLDAQTCSGSCRVARHRQEKRKELAAVEDPRRCRSCGHTGIARDEAGEEYGGGAHVEMTGLCWFCWKTSPEGKESMARLETALRR